MLDFVPLKKKKFYWQKCESGNILLLQGIQLSSTLSNQREYSGNWDQRNYSVLPALFYWNTFQTNFLQTNYSLFTPTLSTNAMQPLHFSIIINITLILITPYPGNLVKWHHYSSGNYATWGKFLHISKHIKLWKTDTNKKRPKFNCWGTMHMGYSKLG